jgi:DNA modification methylase
MIGTTNSISILQGDSVEQLRTFPDRSIDMIFTSPPFKDEDVPGDYWEFYDTFFQEALRVTSKVICIIHSSTKMNHIIAKYPPKRTMIWSKGVSQYTHRYNPIFCYQISEDYKINKFIWSDAFGVQAVNGMWKSHTFQDPVLLYSTIIRMFKGCNLICDPFMGSGTTGLACKSLDKKFIGIDISEENCNTAKVRIEQENIDLWLNEPLAV